MPDSGVHSFPYATGPAVLQVDGLALSTTYTFNVVTIDAAGGRSDPTSVTQLTGSGAPAKPANFRFTSTTNQKTGIIRFTFSWDAVPGATSYTFNSGAGSGDVVRTTTTFSFSVYGDDTEYVASVTATNASGSSAATLRTYIAPWTGCNGCVLP